MGSTMPKKSFVAKGFEHYQRDWHFSPALAAGGFVFLSGITGVRPDGSLSSDPETQFRDTFNFVSLHLEAAGLELHDIVDLMTFHVGLRKHLKTFMKVKDEFIAAPYPTWTAIGVSELITEGTLLEIRIVAASRTSERGRAP
jgi:enamine deaminase RidA (YjgF/YER057c/UK114 family)